MGIAYLTSEPGWLYCLSGTSERLGIGSFVQYNQVSATMIALTNDGGAMSPYASHLDAVTNYNDVHAWVTNVLNKSWTSWTNSLPRNSQINAWQSYALTPQHVECLYSKKNDLKNIHTVYSAFDRYYLSINWTFTQVVSIKRHRRQQVSGNSLARALQHHRARHTTEG